MGLPLLLLTLPMAMLLPLRVLPLLCVDTEHQQLSAPLFPMAMLPVEAMLLILLELCMLPREKLRLMLMLSMALMVTMVLDILLLLDMPMDIPHLLLLMLLMAMLPPFRVLPSLSVDMELPPPL